MRVRIRYKYDPATEQNWREYHVISDGGRHVEGPFSSEEDARQWIKDTYGPDELPSL